MPQKGIKRVRTNLYEIRVARLDPRTGLRKELRRQVEGSEDDALAARVDLLAEFESGASAVERQRLKDYGTTWLKSRVHRLKPSTAKKYAEILELHVFPALGDFYLDMLRPTQVAEFVSAQSAKLAGWTVINQLRLLRTIAKGREGRRAVPSGLLRARQSTRGPGV